MIASPPPVLRIPIGGTCDANGNLTLKSIVPSRSWYGVFTAILKVSSGAPQWEIDLLGMPVGLAGGGSAVMGAIYSNPEDSFTLIVSGAAPNAVVSGGLYGFLATGPEGLPQLGAISSGGSGGTSGALPSGQAVARATLFNANDAIALLCGGASYISFGFGTGTLVAGSTFVFEGTEDDVNWVQIPWFGYGTNSTLPPAWNTSTLPGSLSFTNSVIVVASGGLSQVRCRLLAVGGGQLALSAIARATPGATLPSPTGQQASTSSIPVVIANNQSNLPVLGITGAADLAVTATAAAGVGVTATLPAVSGKSHYIVFIQIVRFAAALLVAAATPVLVTTGDLAGTIVFSFPADAAAAGTVFIEEIKPTIPIKSFAPNAATTIICPATTNVIWRINVWYRVDV